MRPIVISALVPDIKRIYDIYFAAFEHEQMAQIMLKILFPGGITDEFRAAHTVNTLAFWNICSYQYTMKCLDLDGGEIVGMLLADLHVKHRSVEERQNFGVPWLEGAEKERAEKVLNPLWEAKEKLWGGRPYIYVHVIAISPDHQGKHAGIALINWGIEMGEKSQLPIYCEASPTTYKLYLKFGFKQVKEKLVHKKELLGTPTDIEVPLMVWMPSGAAGLSFDEWRESGYPSWETVAKTNEARKAIEAEATKEIAVSETSEISKTPETKTSEVLKTKEEAPKTEKKAKKSWSWKCWK